MGYYCTVPQCTSLAGKTKNVKFHRFPRDEDMADKWNVILKRGKPYTKYSKVCSLHFTQADYNVTTMGQWKTLNKDAVPTQNLPKLNPDGTVMVIRKSRTVKYREGKKEDTVSNMMEKSEKWQMVSNHNIPSTITESAITCTDPHDSNYRLQIFNAMANNMSPQNVPNRPINSFTSLKPKKQDAFMQTDPIQSEEDDSQPNNSYSEVSDKYNTDYSMQSYEDNQKTFEPKDYTKTSDDYTRSSPDYTKSTPDYTKTEYVKTQDYPRTSPDYPKTSPDYTKASHDYPKTQDYTKATHDYTKTTEDYIPQTNEEYNKEAEKYALERKSLNGYEKMETYPKSVALENGYQKIDMYQDYSKYQRPDFGYQNGYPDSADHLRNQQHNLQILQEQHRITENQNFFNESHIKQEIDINGDDEKFIYERSKEQLDANSMYSGDSRRLMQQQRLLEHLQQQVKQEPETPSGCESVMQPQSSPYYPNGHNNVTGPYYDPLSRPGPELLIAKQNALAAHTQLWQNTMKRPFYYSDSSHYNSTQLLHRYDDLSRILQ